MYVLYYKLTGKKCTYLFIRSKYKVCLTSNKTCPTKGQLLVFATIIYKKQLLLLLIIFCYSNYDLSALKHVWACSTKSNKDFVK